MALPLFAITLFVSAFLLFLVQPLIGKMILPNLGGTPQVWNTCMLFFQTTLLLGYFYTHATSKLPVKRQMLVHCFLLIVPLLFLLPRGLTSENSNPFSIVGWVPPPGANPIASTLMLLAVVVGLPFLVVSTSAPLLQKWFSQTGHPSANDPYFLYGASNLGSLLSLVLYPFLVEPMLKLQTQAWVWTVSFILLAVMIVACALLVLKSPSFRMQLAAAPIAPPPTEPPPPAPVVQPSTAVKAGPSPAAARSTGITRKKGLRKPDRPGIHTPSEHHHTIAGAETYLPSEERVTWARRLRWILLAFAPSSLMLGVTSYCSVDLSPFPLLWVIPLALYLLSFILVFSKWPVPWVGTPHKFMLFLGAPAVCILLWVLLQGGFDPFKATILSFVGFFLVTMMCHGELAKDRPTPEHLTDYFLIMSIGGALGGVFNALFAPILFVGVAEYPIAIVVAALLRPREKPDGWMDELLLSAFPRLSPWARDTGDNIAVALGRPAPRSHWILNGILDLFIGLFVYGLTLFVVSRMSGQAMLNILKFLGFSENNAAYYVRTGNVRALFLFGPALLICLLVGFNRGTRFGICVAALLLAHLGVSGRDGDALYKGRSYFGVLRVFMDFDSGEALNDPDIDRSVFDPMKLAPYTYLMHGTTYHGKNFHYPESIRRLATTYYHRKGPVGVIMERWNWGSDPKNPPKQNTYYADARLPVSMIGMGTSHVGGLNIPLHHLCDAVSEPPIATIGLGTGTMASYGRWLQHVTFYEIDETIRNFSLPPTEQFVLRDLVVKNARLTAGELEIKANVNDPYFTYLVDAIRRGVKLEVVMGDARLSMFSEDPKATRLYSLPEPGKELPSKEIAIYSTHEYTSKVFAQRENYYKVIEVDAFSSDAIPLHLITQEAIAMYFSKLADDGVVCMHTSNRHMNLVWPVVDIAASLKKKWRVGHDVSDNRDTPPYLGHFGSEYVMLANFESFPDGRRLLPADGKVKLGKTAEQEWATTRYARSQLPPGMPVWTNDYSNIVSILR